MKKIAIGNNINIKLDDCIIETDRIEIKDTIDSSFTFNITRDGSIIKTIEFPVGETSLFSGDILDYNGIHRGDTGELIPYVEEQFIAFENMSNIRIS